MALHIANTAVFQTGDVIRRSCLTSLKQFPPMICPHDRANQGAIDLGTAFTSIRADDRLPNGLARRDLPPRRAARGWRPYRGCVPVHSRRCGFWAGASDVWCASAPSALFQHAARLNKQTRIDRFVRYLHALVGRELPLQICSGDHCSASFCATRQRSSLWSARRQSLGRSARCQALLSTRLAR